MSSSAVRAMPMANAPTLGRKRSSVPIATRKPSPGAPNTCSGPTGTSSKVSEPMAWAASMSRDSPLSPGESPGTAKAVSPRAPVAAALRAKTVYTSASGALEIHSFSPLRRYPPSPSGAACSDSAAGSEPASGSVSANAATAVPAATPGIHCALSASDPAWAIG